MNIRTSILMGNSPSNQQGAVIFPREISYRMTYDRIK